MTHYTRLEAAAAKELARLSRSLPETIRKALHDVPVHLQPKPDADIAAELGDDLLGLFSGEPIDQRGESLVAEPPQIHLFLENIWEFAESNPALYREEVRITILHELGHYLGWGEAEIKRYGID